MTETTADQLAFLLSRMSHEALTAELSRRRRERVMREAVAVDELYRFTKGIVGLAREVKGDLIRAAANDIRQEIKEEFIAAELDYPPPNASEFKLHRLKG